MFTALLCVTVADSCLTVVTNWLSVTGGDAGTQGLGPGHGGPPQ